MTNPIDPTQLSYLLQHISDLRKITKTQAMTLFSSSIGAAATAYFMTTPHDWNLIVAAGVGALITNVLHLIQAPPGQHQ